MTSVGLLLGLSAGRFVAICNTVLSDFRTSRCVNSHGVKITSKTSSTLE